MDQVVQVPGKESDENDRRDDLDRRDEPPFGHLEGLGVAVELVKYLGRLEEPACSDHFEDSRDDQRVAVDEVVYDVKDRKARARYVDKADDAFHDADGKRRLLFAELELIGYCGRDALDDREERVDRKRYQAEVEDEREDHVKDRT